MKTALILILWIPVIVFADGMPIKEGRIDSAKTVIELGAFQKVTAKFLGFVWLNNSQRERFPNAASISSNILFLQRLSDVENDCTCFIGESGILVNSDTVDFPHFLAGSKGEIQLGGSFKMQYVAYALCLSAVMIAVVIKQRKKKKKIEHAASCG